MIKQAPGVGKIILMIVFTLSVFGLLMFLWMTFGGSLPLKPESYRVRAYIPEAATLANEADVRMAGVNIGKVKMKELDKRGARTIVILELKNAYGPLAKDTRAQLRQKTLLGETYVDLTPGHKKSGILKDGGEIGAARVEKTVELDEIFSAFDDETRNAVQVWVKELAKASKGNGGQNLNDAFGNLEGFAVDGATLMKVLDEQELAVRRLVKNTGVVFGAINEREGALGQLITNANNTFEATASRDQALADTFQVFPTFLDESKATVTRLERFSRNTRPLVNDLKGPADDLGPTVRDLGDLAPDLEKLFRDLGPLIRAGDRGLPALRRVLRGAEPFVESAHTFFPEINPILSYISFHQATVANFITNAGADLIGKWGSNHFGQTQIAIIDPRGLPIITGGLQGLRKRPFYERGNAYLQPNALQRAIALGGFESFDCIPAGGTKTAPTDADSAADKAPPCFVAPGSLYNNKQFVRPTKGNAPLVKKPGFREGRTPAVDPNPGD